LLRAKARWTIPEVDGAAVGRLTEQLNISPLVARLLAVRGITDAGEAERFLNSSEDQFHDPFLLDGMKAAVERIRAAVHGGEKIRIYGDYDADGVCAVSLMIGLMRELGARFDYYIPHRRTEGYGMNRDAVESARADGVRLIVTVDTGISAAAEAAYARELGIDVIVTDHHQPPETLPDACAVVNPKKPGCPYPFKELAGVGVAFKLAHALLGELPHRYLEYAATGTVADLMPLTGENRLIVKMGLQRLRVTKIPGFRALAGVAGLEQRELGAAHIGFAIAPRINAVGRLERADSAVACLTTDDEAEAERLAGELDRMNRERQAIAEAIAEEAAQQVEAARAGGLSGKVIVAAGEDWNVGVVGIVASKLLEKYYRPALVFSIDPVTGTAKGSARSIPGFDIHRALTACAEWLDHFGGHRAAAGMTLHRDRLPDLRRALNEIAERELGEELLTPELRADMELSLADVSVRMIEGLEALAPFGIGNPPPRFILEGLAVKEIRKLGRDERHLKLLLAHPEDESLTIDALGFGKADLWPHISKTASVDVLGELSVNEWNGGRRAQIVIHDIRIRELQVFDWRSRTAGGSALKVWLETPSERDSCKGILIFRRRDGEWLVRESGRIIRDAALWLADFRRGVVPLNETAERARASEIAELLVYSLPPSVELLEAALPHFASVERLYGIFRDTVPFLSAAPPTRDQCKLVYGLLLGEDSADAEAFAEKAARAAGLSADTVQFALAMFEDLQIVKRKAGRLMIVPAAGKKNLEDAAVLLEKKHREAVEQVLVYSTAQELKAWMTDRLRPRQTHMALEESV